MANAPDIQAISTSLPATRIKSISLGGFARANRMWLSTLVALLVLWAIFLAANPVAFTSWPTYNSILVTVPIVIFLVVPLTYIVTSGEIDLSFPSVMGMAAWVFALVIQAGADPFIAFLAAAVAGTAIGYAVGALVVHAGLSSLVATLGMNFVLRGLINIATQAQSIAVPSVRESLFYQVAVGRPFGVPMQVVWAVLFVGVATYIFHRHRFGVRVHCVGDNPESTAQMGIPVGRVRIQTFAFMGLGAALAGVFSVLINFIWWPTAGEGYLLTVIASVFVGGTPTWGGIGTILGGAIGAIIVTVIEAGVVAAGLTGFYVQFFNGLIIILALIGHRFHSKRVR